ncbi:unnamed protein product [Owenia fusiformis]|uniref:Nose resistant-to-fluoxetine protein N-terminal domain-containing protein n=1 Tax=Owenia fusiformis TaxID=6347 RepID=A0A8S4P447_OWEFU|nr:unnamed protein product [Owenia fusiformis]
MNMGTLFRGSIGLILCVSLSVAQEEFQKRNIFPPNQFQYEISEDAKTLVSQQISNDDLENLRAGLGRYTNVSKTCLDHTMMILDGVRAGEFWALEMLDAVGKPPSAILRGNFKWLGSFSQCTNITAWVNVSGKVESPFSGKHCMATIVKAYGTPNKQLGSGPLPAAYGKIALSIAVCVPSSCDVYDVAGLVNSGLFALPENYIVYPLPTCTNTNIPLDWRAILAIVIFSIFGCLVVLATLLDALIYMVELNEPKEHATLKDVIEDVIAKEPANGVVNVVTNHHNATEYTPLIANNTQVAPKPTQHGIALRMLLCFSAYTNGDKILKVGPPSESSLDCVHGIRFFSMTWVMLCHTYFFGLVVTANPALLGDYLKRYSFQAIINGYFSVDAFFFLSGLLVSYLVLRELKAKNGKLNWIMYYFHRFWRLTPPYMLILMFSACLSRYVSTGPLWPEQGFERNYCNDTWWTNLLYINNFVKDDKMCMGWSWYLANDMQFHWISPILIIAFFKSAIAGYIVTGAMLLGHLIVTGTSWVPKYLHQAIYTNRTISSWFCSGIHSLQD